MGRERPRLTWNVAAVYSAGILNEAKRSLLMMRLMMVLQHITHHPTTLMGHGCAGWGGWASKERRKQPQETTKTNEIEYIFDSLILIWFDSFLFLISYGPKKKSYFPRMNVSRTSHNVCVFVCDCVFAYHRMFLCILRKEHLGFWEFQFGYIKALPPSYHHHHLNM